MLKIVAAAALAVFLLPTVPAIADATAPCISESIATIDIRRLSYPNHVEVDRLTGDDVISVLPKLIKLNRRDLYADTILIFTSMKSPGRALVVLFENGCFTAKSWQPIEVVQQIIGVRS